MNGRLLDTLDRSPLVNGLANDVDDTTEAAGADVNLNGSTGVEDLLATDETLGTVHGNGTDRVLTQVLGDLEHEAGTLDVLDVESVVDGGQVLGVELDVDDGANDRLRCVRVGVGVCVSAKVASG